MQTFYRLHGETVWNRLETTGEPSYAEADPGGYYEASAPCDITQKLRQQLEGADLRIDGPTRPVFFGRVDDAADYVHAWGHQTYLDDVMREALYCQTRTSEWTERGLQSALKNANIDTYKNDVGIYFCVGPTGGAVATGAWASQVLRVPNCSRIRIDFDAHKPSNALANWAITVFCGVAGGGSTTEPITWSANIWEKDETASGSSWTSQSVERTSASMSLASIDYVGIYAGVATGYSPGINKTAGFSNLKVYATSNGSACITPTAPNILNDSLDRLTMTPDAVCSRIHIDADTTDLGQADFGPASKESDKHAAVVYQAGYRYGWWAKPYAGTWYPMPVYKPRSTTPDYYCLADGIEVIEHLAPTPLSNKASVVRVLYQDAGGAEVYADVTDTDLTHPLVSKGITRYKTVTIDTTSATTANSAGARELSDVGRATKPGTIEVLAPIQAAGRKVEPCDIEAGNLLQVAGTRFGTVTGRIVRVDKVGRMRATVTLEGTPLDPRRTLDRYLGRA